MTVTLFFFSASSVVISHWLYAVLCCDPLKDMANILHLQQPNKAEKGEDIYIGDQGGEPF